MHLITIIIPYFKKKKFIKETLLSVLNQTYKNFEVIIVYDDLDHTDLNYIKKLEQLDTRISLIINEKNLGAGLSRNKAILSARGEYIAFLDSDDTWEVAKLENQLKFMQTNNLNISHTSYQIMDNKNNKIKKRIARSFNNVNELLKSCDIGLSTVMIKRNIFLDDCFFPETKTKEDFILWLKILKKNHKIGGLDQILMNWRKLENSLSSSTIQKLRDGFNVYYKHMNFSFLKSIYYLFCLSINYLKK